MYFELHYLFAPSVLLSRVILDWPCLKIKQNQHKPMLCKIRKSNINVTVVIASSVHHYHGIFSLVTKKAIYPSMTNNIHLMM